MTPLGKERRMNDKTERKAMVRIIKNPEERKREIIRAAHALFKTKGYEDTTIQNVMATLDIAKGTIYHYFKSKEDLLEAVVRDIVDVNFREMSMALDASKKDALTKFKLLIKKGNISVGNAEILEHLHHPSNQSMHCRVLAEIITKHATLYAKVIEQGNQEGVFKAKNPLECAEFFLSGIQFLTDFGFYPWSEKDLKRRVKAFSTILEQLLGAPPSTFKFLFR